MSDLPGDFPTDDSGQVQPQVPIVPLIAPSPKEQREAFAPAEVLPAAEEAETHKEEVESWLERLERGEDIHLPQPVVDDQSGQVLVEPASLEHPEIVLPVTEAAIKRALHMKVWDSLLWLAEWSKRIIKMFPGRVFYRSE